MKISDVKGERSFTISKEVLPYIVKFSENEHFKKVFDTSDLPKGDLPEDKVKRGEAVMAKIADNLPDIIDSCRDNLVRYFALLEDVVPEKYMEDITVGKIYNGITDMFNDDVFRTFFIPLLKKPLMDKD